MYFRECSHVLPRVCVPFKISISPNKIEAAVYATYKGWHDEDIQTISQLQLRECLWLCHPLGELLFVVVAIKLGVFSVVYDL